MAWPRRIYVATTALGVYYTENFSDPGVQPIWTAVNDGLPALDCREFALDPFDPAGRQYTLLDTGGTLYRRESSGTWTAILTPAQAAILVNREGQGGDGILWFCVDPATDGRLYAFFHITDNVWHSTGYALRSSDYGTTWVVAGTIGDSFTFYGAHGIKAYDNNVYATGSWGTGSVVGFRYSTDYGAAWASVGGWLIQWNPVALNPLLPDRFYSTDDPQGNVDLMRITNTGALSMLQDGLGPGREDAMWFDPVDANHQRLIRDGKIYVTTDEWTTVNAPDAISPAPVSFAPWAGADTDQIIVGLGLVEGTPPAQPHVIGALYGDDDTTAVGIAGANAGTAPYTDSIPATCGGVARGGIAALDAIGIVHTYGVAMPGYTGSERGTPVSGDRASWATGETHAQDIAGDELTRHLPAPSEAGRIVIDQGDVYESHAVSGDGTLDADGTLDVTHADAADEVPWNGVTDKPEFVQNNFGAEVDPTIDDDDTAGYAVGSRWINTVDGTEFVCTDASEGAAVWAETTGGGTVINALDDIGDVDAPDPDENDVLTFKEGYWVSAPGGGGGGSGGAYAETIGDGTETGYDVEHSLNTTDIVVQVWDLDATPIELVAPDGVYVIDTDTVRVVFASAPDVDQMRVVALMGGSSGGGDFVNPMTTLGDLIRGDSGGTPERLEIGSEGQVLTVVSGIPAWADAPSGGSVFLKAASIETSMLSISFTESEVEV